VTISNCIRSGINKLCAARSPARRLVFERGTLSVVSQRALPVKTDMARQLRLLSTLAARAAPLLQQQRPAVFTHAPRPSPHCRRVRRPNPTLTCARRPQERADAVHSHMLNTHLTNAYPPAVLGGPARTGFVDVLACHQTPQFSSWCAPSRGPT